MTQPRPADTSSVLHLAWPLVVSFVLRQLFTFVDMAYARTMGDAAVAAIGLSYPLEFLLIAFWVGASTGMTSLLSRAMGAHEGERAEQVIRTTKHVVLALAGLFTAVGIGIWFVAPLLAKKSPDGPGIPPEMVEPFRIYASVIVGGTALTGFWSIIPDSIVKAHQDTKATMWAGTWGNVANVVLNTVFLFVFHWGMLGIALSTVIGRLVALAYAMRRAAHHERKRDAAGLDTIPGTYVKPLRALLVLSVPATLTYVLMALESGVVNALLARLPAATESIAAFAVYHRWLMLLLMPVIATGVAVLPFTGRLWGRRDVGGIRRAFRHVTIASLVYTVLLVMPLALVGRHALAALFAESPLTRELAATALLLAPLAALVSIPFFTCRPVLDGMQLATPGLISAALRYLFLTAPCALAGAAIAARLGQPQLHGVIVGLVVATAVASLVLLAWMRRALAAADVVS